jgi:hypothetical protein
MLREMEVVHDRHHLFFLFSFWMMALEREMAMAIEGRRLIHQVYRLESKPNLKELDH